MPGRGDGRETCDVDDKPREIHVFHTGPCMGPCEIQNLCLRMEFCFQENSLYNQ